MFESRVIIFKEICYKNQTFFLWFKTCDNHGIIPDRILNEEEHWELLETD